MPEKLKEYNKKRNFDKTSEPKGKKSQSSDLKFVVQHHIARRNHFDFRLEWRGVLLSWAVPKGPSYNPADKRLAVQVEDHPLDYRNFEGTIPKGQYGGGTVMVWDEGNWDPLTDVKKGLFDGVLKFSLSGHRLKGKWSLIKMKGDKNWILIKEKDEYSKKEEGISHFITSIKTGRTMKEIELNKSKKLAKNPFKKVDVQLAKLSSSAPEDGDWIYEIKYDGYRIIAFVEDNKVRLMTRNHKDFTHHFKDVERSLKEWGFGRAMVLDGEMVISDSDGRTDFQLLQNHMRNTDQSPTYIIFDLLALDGKDLRKKPLHERKSILKDIMKNVPDNLYYSSHIKGKGKEIFSEACKIKVEGIIGKKENSVYTDKRNGSWIKLKCNQRQEFVIGGYVLTDKKDRGISSLLLGYFKKDSLIFAGRAGTGMTQQISFDLEKQLKIITQKKCPFDRIPEIKKTEKVTYVKPLIVAEIQFAGWTQDNVLRQASFKGVRVDKKAQDVVIEKAELIGNDNKRISIKEDSNGNVTVGGVKITNPNKIMFGNPDIKKIDIIEYYVKVSKRMLPYLQNRVLSIVRCPKGVFAPCFFRKHTNFMNEGLDSIMVTNREGKKSEFYYIKNIYGLILEAQMSTIEFHTWGSEINNLDKPDIMVFDLDPYEKMELARVRQGAKDLKKILDKLSLISFLKTSGGKGYHIVVPFKPSANWDKFYAFAKYVAKVMEETWPDRYTCNVRKINRKNKIFIDWVRNGKGATSVVPYSIRARKGGAVAMPISWRELDKVSPNGIDMKEALLRLGKTDPWKDFFKINQDIKL